MGSFSTARAFLALILVICSTFTAVIAQNSTKVPFTLDQRVLIIGVGNGQEESPVYTLKGYSIPYTVLNIPPTALLNGSLPLEKADGSGGLYSLIVLTNGGLAADFGNSVFKSVLSADQWNQLYAYQSKYDVRLVALNDIPGNAGSQGATSRALGTWGTSDPHVISIADTTVATRAGLKSTAQFPTTGIFHIPAVIENSTIATPLLTFKAISGSTTWTTDTSAAVVYKFGTATTYREQMSFFMPFGSWSATSLAVSHLWVQWGTRGLYNGFRRVLMTPTIDDFFLFTEGYDETGKYVEFRTSVQDVEGVIAWQKDINSRLPAGSTMRLELAFNGNGILQNVDLQTKNTEYALSYDVPFPEPPADWKKPLGTGYSIWPNPPPSKTAYRGQLTKDPLFSYFKSNKTALTSFWWNSHTFSHEILNNNTYGDTYNEISYNYDMAQQLGLTSTPNWSNFSMVTPGISGLFNGDALKALLDFGITASVGDSSRPKTLNSTNPEFWPMITTVDANGYAGFTAVPRSATQVFFNCTNPTYNALLYNNIYGGSVTFDYVVKSDVDRVTRMLLGLSWVPYMFHQANLRTADAVTLPNPNKNGQQERLSLTAYWVESVLASLYQYVTWPIVSYKSDDFTTMFRNRAVYENCGVTASVSGVRDTVTGQVVYTDVAVTSTSTCTAPLTVPVDKTNIQVTSSTFKTEQLGSDPLTVWLDLKAGTTAKVHLKTSLVLN
ncbi:hypothetical protein HDU96_003953 [Phlyctochytrium bullatum]|nr:hypothetical protein HDU96_003953 [Phlyctochytrium bullatum]